MAFSLNSNIGAANICRGINSSYSLMSKSMEKLASGLKINRASDDPAGLVISEQMRSRIASLNQEVENISSQINKYETASSATMQLRGILTEVRSLAVAASNGAINDPAIQQAYQAEADRLVSTYNSIIESAAFGTQKLFDGSEGSLTTISELAGVDFSDAVSSEEAIESIDEEIQRLDSTIADIGATQKNDLESRRSSLMIEAENLTAAESQIRDTDFASEVTSFLRNQMLLHSSLSLLAYSNISPQSTLALLIDK